VSRFSADPKLSYTLPATWYYDPAIAAKERENIFFRTWQFMGFVSDLQQPGSFIRGAIFDQEILVTRDKQMKLHAFYNICTHRGSLLASESKGCVKALVCPYHGWTFDTDGTLKAAANSENVACFDKREFALHAVRVEELANMVFVNLDPNAVSLREQAGDIEQDFRQAIPNFDQLKVWRRDPAAVNANWKIVIENFLECYHCTYAHPQLMGSDDSLCGLSFESVEKPFWSRHIMRCGAERAKNIAYDYSPNDAVQDGWIWMLWPNTLFMTWPADSNLFVFHVIPDGPEKTRETFDLLCLGGDPGPTEKAMFDYHSEVVNGEDIFVVEGAQKAIHARAFKEGRLMVDGNDSWRSEHGVHHFDHLIWHALHD
jgi:choline monooxygenase